MQRINREIIKKIKSKYPKGARVELLKMEDYHAPPIGTKGTVIGIDDIGSIKVKWDTGIILRVVYQEDECRKI